MKNTNRYKLVPVLVIGLVLSTFSAMAEVKTITKDGTITIKEGEVGTCVLWTYADVYGYRVTLSITKDGHSISLGNKGAENVLNRYPNFKIAGPASFRISGGGMLSVEIKPNEKH